MNLARLSWLALALASLACGGSTPAASTQATAAEPKVLSKFHQFEEKSIDGKPVAFRDYAGKVVLVVNVASRCGFTGQYQGLEALYKKHEAEGLVILGFPCDQFGNQEPGTEEEIKRFCSMTYGVSFPMFKKIQVNGPNANPLYVYLREAQPGSFSKDMPGAEKLYAHLESTMPEVLGTDAVKWNFTKFLVDRKGNVVRRFESPETPEAIESEVTKLLAQKD